MHPARFSFLCGKHAVTRKVVSVEWTVSGSIVTLECGHVQSIAPHFDCSRKTEARCDECAPDVVRKIYASEFA